MEFYQLKIIRKGTKPPVWRRCLVPSNITFAQMAAVLEEILEYSFTDRYEFEFYQEKVHVREYREDEPQVTSYQYDFSNASDTFVNDLLDKMTWFTFRVKTNEQKLPEYRAEVEKKLPAVSEGGGALCPVIMKEKQAQRKSSGRIQSRKINVWRSCSHWRQENRITESVKRFMRTSVREKPL